jgi:2-polyprenyl-3-methyl-5-hydroxy-6-metoxy-1,4-benzoquinol methylase
MQGWDAQEVQARLARYNWYHVIDLGGGLATPGWAAAIPGQQVVLRALDALDLRGKRVLDVGCRDGLFCFAAERRGAREVVGIDNDLSAGAAEFLVPYFGSAVRLRELNVYDLLPETFGRFDVVICPGVLYHLRYPFWGLKRLADVLAAGGVLVLETVIMVDENRFPLLWCPYDSDLPCDLTSCTFFNVKALTETLHSLGLEVESVTYLHHTPAHTAPAPEAPARWLSRLALRHRGAPTPAGEPPRLLPTDRATLVCRPSAARPVNPVIHKYWHGTHKVHTKHKGILAD